MDNRRRHEDQESEFAALYLYLVVLYIHMHRCNTEQRGTYLIYANMPYRTFVAEI